MAYAARYSAPQSPIDMIMFLLFDCTRIASMSALSLSVSENVKVVALSSLLSLRPSLAPESTIKPT